MRIRIPDPDPENNEFLYLLQIEAHFLYAWIRF
jgi:hypothetical protein